MVSKKVDETTLVFEFHESPWAGHKGRWATFKKPKEKYWWPAIYKDVAHFVRACASYQIHSNIQHRDKVWGEGQMKYLALLREDLTTQVEERALRNKTMAAVSKFLLEDIIC